jgi:hypothetical protein
MRDFSMNYESLLKDGVALRQVSQEHMNDILEAVVNVYPLIVLANLTQNKYFLIRNQGFLYNSLTETGTYDDLIDDNAENIHEHYQQMFTECFSRKSLMREYENGKTEVYAELYQKNPEGKYRWVSLHCVRISDDSGDIMHLCFNRPLDGIVAKRLPRF